VRAGNEDAFAVLPHLGLFAVADGMGGAAAGEVAARMVLDGLREAFEDCDVTWPRSAGVPRREPGAALLAAAIHRANHRIRHEASRDADKTGMGTTVAGLLVHEDRVALAHVGDSRIYRLRGRRLERLTEDHSWVGMMVQRGLLTAEEAETDARRNVLLRAVGGHEVIEVDTRWDAATAGDVYMLCSDGLHGALSDGELGAVLLAHHDLVRAANALVERANDAGGPDNITVVLVRLGG
jgi:protein phosphatase